MSQVLAEATVPALHRNLQERTRVRCCIAGGGPAGMMLGVLLARAGVNVMVLEKHRDFLRDFRGDTIHPSTLALMHQLGWLDEFLTLPHHQVTTLSAQIGDTMYPVVDFRSVPGPCKFVELIPQWDFLNFLATKGRTYPNFDLRLEAEVAELRISGDRVCGVKLNTPTGMIDVEADLVVGADGRHSTVRAAAGLQPVELGAPMDVLWFRVDKAPNSTTQTGLHVDAGALFITLDRESYWQCGFVIAKGTFEVMRRSSFEMFRDRVARLGGFRADEMQPLRSWDDVKLLTVQVDRLQTWHRPGLLCIGDAAHAMSPIGGVGINLAIADAVAAANVLAQPLRDGARLDGLLGEVQRRRAFATRVIQRLQVAAGNHIVVPVLQSKAAPTVPFMLRLLAKAPIMRRWLGRILGWGIGTEPLATPQA